MSIKTRPRRAAGTAALGSTGVAQHVRTPALVTVEVEPTGDEAELTPFRLQFDARLIDGRYQVHQATLTQVDGGQSVTATSLSAIRWPELMRRALAGLVYVMVEDEAGHTISALSLGAAGRPADDDSTLATYLSYSYLVAHAVGLDPTKEVGAEYGLTQGAAAQRVRRARKAGLLPPTTKGKR